MHQLSRQARRATALVPMCLALLASPLPHATTAAAPAPITGRGWADAVVCVGCIAGALGIASGGAPAVITAIRFPGGAMILAGCARACAHGAF